MGQPEAGGLQKEAVKKPETGILKDSIEIDSSGSVAEPVRFAAVKKENVLLRIREGV